MIIYRSIYILKNHESVTGKKKNIYDDIGFFSDTTTEVHDILEEDGLDFLLNNAGVMMHPQLLTEDKFEIHLQVNYLGNSRLTSR